MRYGFDRGREPTWRSIDGALRRRLPPALRQWLIDTDSLTERLQTLCGSGFRVRLRAQRWRRPAASERAVLGLQDYRVALIREVHLLCGDRPVVFARSIIPGKTLAGSGRRLARLGNRPLGALLFSDPRIVRVGLEAARIDAGHDFYFPATGARNGEGIWGRRSVFLLGERPLLVNEFFLPALLHDRRD